MNRVLESGGKALVKKVRMPSGNPEENRRSGRFDENSSEEKARSKIRKPGVKQFHAV